MLTRGEEGLCKSPGEHNARLSAGAEASGLLDDGP